MQKKQTKMEGGTEWHLPKIGKQVGMQFQIGSECGWGWNSFVYDANRPAILKGNLVKLGVDGNQ